LGKLNTTSQVIAFAWKKKILGLRPVHTLVRIT